MSTPWITTGGPQNGLGFRCARCGAAQEVAAPAEITAYVAAAESFCARHVSCQTRKATTPPLVVMYRNWRGEVRERRITPRAVWYGSTHWHPEAQWMLDATDEETGDLRTFAFAGFNPSKTSNGST